MNTLRTEFPFVVFQAPEILDKSILLGFQVTGVIEGFFGGSTFSSSGFFGVENFGKYLLGLLDLSRDFFRVFKTI